MWNPTKVWPLPISLNTMTITSRFGPRTITVNGVTQTQARHGAIDISAPARTPVLSIDNGEVIKTVDDHPTAGGYVEVLHGNGHTSRYLHLNEIQTRVGAKVKTGQQIALSGGGAGMKGAGSSTGPHLHLEIWKGVPYASGSHLVDPEPYLLELAAGKLKRLIERNSALILFSMGVGLVGYSILEAPAPEPVRANSRRLVTVTR